MSIELTELSINGLFTIKHQAEILDFLERNPKMVSALRDSYDKIKEYFPESNFILESFCDPESPHAEQLIIKINTDKDISATLATLNRMDEEWTCHLSDDVLSKLVITIGS